MVAGIQINPRKRELRYEGLVSSRAIAPRGTRRPHGQAAIRLASASTAQPRPARRCSHGDPAPRYRASGGCECEIGAVSSRRVSLWRTDSSAQRGGRPPLPLVPRGARTVNWRGSKLQAATQGQPDTSCMQITALSDPRIRGIRVVGLVPAGRSRSCNATTKASSPRVALWLS